MADELTESEIERIVLSDPHIKRILPGEEWNIPKIDLALWSGHWSQRKNKDLRYLTDFLGMPYIIDDFETDHEARGQWRSELNSKYGDFWEYVKRDALRGNIIYGSKRVLYFHLGYVGTNSDELRHRSSQIPMLGPDYGTWSTERKVKAVRELKVELYGFLKFLSEQSSAS